MNTPLLDVRNVTKRFPLPAGLLRRKAYLTAVNNVSASVQPGEVVGIVGESGCGKTTLSQIMLGLLAPTAGDVFLDGRPLGSLPRLEIARLVQPVFQDPYGSLNPRQTIEQIVGAPLAIHGLAKGEERRRQVKAMLDLVGLPGRFLNRLPSELSGGQRQRVAIARALVLKPKLLICDEPTSALDVSIQAQVLNLLADLRSELNLTFVIISHNLEVLEYFADRIVVMYLGAVVEQGPAEAIFDDPHHPYTVALVNSALTVAPGEGIHELSLGAASPDPVNLPGGCSFNPRCMAARPLCIDTPPVLRDVGETRVACHFPVERHHEQPTGEPLP